MHRTVTKRNQRTQAVEVSERLVNAGDIEDKKEGSMVKKVRSSLETVAIEYYTTHLLLRDFQKRICRTSQPVDLRNPASL